MEDANHFLEGVCGPDAEKLTAFDLPVTSVYPWEDHGRYLRNGNNPADMLKTGSLASACSCSLQSEHSRRS
jgi:hypothetical protein